MKGLLQKTIKVYKKFISPLLIRRCRFYPSCSTYAYEALEQYGILKAVSLIVWRIARCNPLCEGGFDPVPKNRKREQ